MRSFLVVMVCISFVFVPTGDVLAQAREETPPETIFDLLDSTGRYILGDSEGDVRQPYLKDGKTPHNNQWDQDYWRPEHWADDKKGAREVIDGFYDSGVLVRQYEDKVPVLEVGKPFMRLSPYDQRRVVEFVDYAFEVTSAENSGVFYIVIDQDDGMRLLGLYSEHGLQLQ